MDPALTPRYAERDFWLARRGLARNHPAIACDAFGRCYHLGPADRWSQGHVARPAGRPPRWAKNLPDHTRSGSRFVRSGSKVVCDRTTQICYKKGNVDKSETENNFGERAGDRADDLRDRLGTARLFVPKRGVACDRERRLCLEDGEPDRRLTRRYFGKRDERTADGADRKRKADRKRSRRQG